MVMKNSKFWFVLVVAVALIALSMACGKKDGGATDGGDKPTAKKYVKTGKEGKITGKITYTGAPVEPKKIDTSADPACAQKNPNAMTEDFVVKDGKIANVFVFIKSGTTADGTNIDEWGFDAPTSDVTLDQDGCHYRPHVLGIQTGQKLSVKNSDPTTHNVHPTPKVNPEWNQSQGPNAAPIVKTFSRAETLIPVKCNQHPWMKAYIGVLKHPFFAVSKEDGTFEITGVPPGKYTVVAWSEKGPVEKTMEVTVADSGSATADFAFDGAASASLGRALEVLPAMELPVVR